MKMSKAFNGFLLFVVCVWAHVSWAQPANQLVKESGDEKEVSSTLLWKVEGPEIKTSYLFGTIHMLPQKDFELKEKVSTAFDKAEQLVLELDMDEPGLQMEMMQMAPMKDGSTLKKLMTETEYKQLDTVLTKSVGAGVQMFDNMKPFIVSSMIIPSLMGGQIASFEGTFIGMAKEKKIEILGLETVARQMSMFDEIPYKDQVEDMIEMINEKEKTQNLFNEMLTLYKNEDFEGLYKMTGEYVDNAEELGLMLDSRNKEWIPRIGELAKDKTTFFGVGAGHLGGENGVINLLKKAGYTLTPIN